MNTIQITYMKNLVCGHHAPTFCFLAKSEVQYPITCHVTFEAKKVFIFKWIMKNNMNNEENI